MWLYGFGTGPTGSLKGAYTNNQSNYTVIERPKGYKYGVMSVSEIKRNYVFRNDKFGQFADLLEQSQDSAMFDKFSGNKKDAAVKINFVVQENDDTLRY